MFRHAWLEHSGPQQSCSIAVVLNEVDVPSSPLSPPLSLPIRLGMGRTGSDVGTMTTMDMCGPCLFSLPLPPPPHTSTEIGIVRPSSGDQPLGCILYRAACDTGNRAFMQIHPSCTHVSFDFKEASVDMDNGS